MTRGNGTVFKSMDFPRPNRTRRPANLLSFSFIAGLNWVGEGQVLEARIRCAKSGRFYLRGPHFPMTFPLARRRICGGVRGSCPVLCTKWKSRSSRPSVAYFQNGCAGEEKQIKKSPKICPTEENQNRAEKPPVRHGKLGGALRLAFFIVRTVGKLNGGGCLTLWRWHFVCWW